MFEWYEKNTHDHISTSLSAACFNRNFLRTHVEESILFNGTVHKSPLLDESESVFLVRVEFIVLAWSRFFFPPFFMVFFFSAKKWKKKKDHGTPFLWFIVEIRGLLIKNDRTSFYLKNGFSFTSQRLQA